MNTTEKVHAADPMCPTNCLSAPLYIGTTCALDVLHITGVMSVWCGAAAVCSLRTDQPSCPARRVTAIFQHIAQRRHGGDTTSVPSARTWQLSFSAPLSARAATLPLVLERPPSDCQRAAHYSAAEADCHVISAEIQSC